MRLVSDERRAARGGNEEAGREPTTTGGTALDFRRYLRAKATVDARARHADVGEIFRGAVARIARRSAGAPVRVVEVGGGAGGAFGRWMELLASCSEVEFLATEADHGLLAAYHEEVTRWGAEAGLEAVASGPARVLFESALPRARRLDVRIEAAWVPEGPAGRFDVLLSQSFWDLLPRGTAVRFAHRLLEPGGLFHAALTFGGETGFEPAHPADGLVLERYHRSMGGARGGDPEAGLQLIKDFLTPGSGFRVLAAGPSPWEVTPSNGGYAADERSFLETILGFIAREIAPDREVPEAVWRSWIAARRRQLVEGRLAYRALQTDLAAERISAPSSAPR